MQRRHSTEFKVKVVLEALRERKTLAELASEHGVHAVQISQWKKQALDGLPNVFRDGRIRGAKEEEAKQDELYREIGRLKVELDWWKKNQVLELEPRRALVEPGHPELSIGRQCELLDVSRSGYYFEARGEAEKDLTLKRLIDEQYLRTPFYC